MLEAASWRSTNRLFLDSQREAGQLGERESGESESGDNESVECESGERHEAAITCCESIGSEASSSTSEAL